MARCGRRLASGVGETRLQLELGLAQLARIELRVHPAADAVEPPLERVHRESARSGRQLVVLHRRQRLPVVGAEEEYPELIVNDSATGYKAVAYDKLTAVLLEAVKELKTQNDELKKLICINHTNSIVCQN